MKNVAYTSQKRQVVTETDTIEAGKTSLVRRHKSDTSRRKRARSRHEKHRYYAAKKLHVVTETDTIEA